MGRTKSWLWAAMVVATASPAAAQVKPGSPVIVMDIFDPRNRVVAVSAANFNQALAEANQLASPIERLVDACTGQEPADRQTLNDPNLTALQRDRLKKRIASDDVIARLEQCVECLAAFQETRYITDRRDHVLLFVLFDRAAIQPKDIRPFFEETARNSELIATGKALADILRAEATAKLSCLSFSYTLQHRRSHFKVSLVKPERAAASAAPNPLNPTASTGAPAPSTVRSPELTLGPTEHWILSADFSIAKASVKLASDPAADAEALKAKDFFIGLNFAIGDLLADRENPIAKRSFWHDFVIKVQATPSKQPWTAWGVGLGLRGYRIKTILWNMDVVHPYVALDRQAEEDGSRKWRAVAGLGFDPRSLNR